MKTSATAPRFFASALEFREWLRQHHATAQELWVGFYKRGSGKPSLTWPESVDEALCVGWIDGVRKSINEESYVIRFTPRKPDSTWSAINISKMNALMHEGRVLPAGTRAFELRSDTNSRVYSYEQRHAAKFDAATARLFRQNRPAWDYFQSQAPWYRRTTTWWVVIASKEETRRKRLAALMEACARGQPIPGLKRPSKKK